MLKQKSSEYRGYRNSGIRLREEMLPQLGKIYGGHVEAFLPAVHAFDKAHTVMLIEEGLLALPAGVATLRGLRQMEADGVVASRLRSGGGLHSGEQYLIRQFGEDIGGRFHLARSSGDLSTIAINMLQRDKLLAIMRAVNGLRRVLIDLARQHTATILPGYSFGQHAHPMTLAHFWLSWVATLARDFDRLHGAYRRVNVSPAGAAIMVGSNFAINRARTAELLGFDAVHENCADAILEMNADDSLDVPAVIAVLYHSMAKWADDLIQWSTSEFNFIDFPDRYCNTSSIMMQKKNVIGPAEVKGSSAEALGCFVTSYHALKGTTGLPIQERYYALEMLWRVADSAVRDLGWFCDMLPALDVRREHMREQAWRHWATATDLAGALVIAKDMPWRTAHQIVGILVRLCEERGLGPADVTPALLDEAASLYHEQPAGLDQNAIREALDPERFIAARTLRGGPAPVESLRQAKLFEELTAADEATVTAIDTRRAQSAQKLETAMDAILADRNSTPMKIISVKTYLVHEQQRKNFIFVKLETDAGISGWGEAHTSLDMDTAVAAHLEQMSRYVIGCNAFNIKHFTQVACDDFAWRHGSLEFYSALSGIEMAMWDIVGKALKQPVYNLLGGAVRPKIRVYANGWFYGTKTPAEHARAAERTVKAGYTALKCYPFQKGSQLPANRLYPPKEDIARGVEIVRAVRDAVGPETDLMVDVCRRLAPMQAIELAQRIAEFNPYWYEEPCPIDNVEALAEIRGKVRIPVVSGETLYNKGQFLPVLEKRAVDILNPDVCIVGGILEMKEIAALAEPHFVAVSPHNFNSTVIAQAATVQVAATMTNFLIAECFVAFLEQGRKIATQLEVKNGYITLPEGPGLGVEIDEAALAKYPYKQFDKRAFRTYKDEGP